jgi:hypothetical protein
VSLPPLLMIASGGKPRPRKAPAVRPRECKLQCDVADVLRAHCLPEWRFTHFPAGERRDVITGARLKRYGLQRGWPDVVLISPAGVFHGLELKRPGETLTDDQAEFQIWCVRHGIPYSVAYSLDQALAFLDALGCLRIKIGGAR